MIKSYRRPKKEEYLPGLPPMLPVVQATLGSCDTPRLAAAVSRAGGLGTLSVHNTEPVSLRRKLQQVRAVTSRPVLLAFTSQWEREVNFETAFREGFRLFQVFWWNGPRLAPRIKRSGGMVFWQVGTVAEARDAVEIGVSVLIAQGTEAGGQVRSPRPVLELVQELREEFGTEIPIIAGGGFADAADVRKVLETGANAALFGTRFLLSEEASAPKRDKARLLNANAGDLRLDARLRGDWPCSPRRRLPTRTDEERTSLYAGLGIGRIGKVMSVAEIVRRLTPAEIY